MGWSFEDIVPVSIRWQQHGGQGQGSPEGAICFESASSIWYSFSHSQDPWVQESRQDEIGNMYNHYTPSDSLEKKFLPVPTTLSFAGLEVLA